MNLSEFFAHLAPQIGMAPEQLQVFADEDSTIGGYIPGESRWIVGSMWEVEGKALYALVRALRPQRMLEVGTRRGCSTTHILTAMEANGTGELVSLDIEPFLGSIPEHLQHRWTFVQTDALAWLKQQTPRHGFDVIFEDGAHSYAFTRDVLALCQKFSAKMTLSHDAAHHLVGADIRQAWDDVYGAQSYHVALIEPSDCGFAYRFASKAKSRSDTPLLSIVSGTYNRLDSLISMIDSVRRQLPEPLAYEFVIVDGGSTDGTPDWCALQPDIRFIQQGELLGAIRAFDAGCAAAQGEYVLLLNDDVLVHDGAVLRALSHLDSHPDCGAVAFADNRQDGSKSGQGAQVGTLYGIQPDGQPVGIPYAQCGMFRRWLGDLAGWWGSTDTEWGAFHTYGGDNRLSARIWEMGYTVDAVEGAAVTDRIAPDALRERNHHAEQQIGSAYMRKWAQGVRIASQPKPENPQREHLRVLLATLYDRGFGHYKRGLRDALAKVSSVVEIDWLRSPEALVRAAWAWQPHLILTQMVEPDLMRRVREYAPAAVIVNWNGDVYPKVLTSPEMMQQCAYTDLQLVVNSDVLPFYAEHGVRAAYWQVAFEPVGDLNADAPAHDVLFMGNNYSAKRAALGDVLRLLPHDVGIYGRNWGAARGDTLYDFTAGASLLRKCKIAVGDNQWNDKGFVSNRLFETLANGAFLLHQTIPGLDELTGIRDGEHLVFWADLDDLQAKVAHWLDPKQAKRRRKIAAVGEKFVREHHSFDCRVKELFEVLLPEVDRVHDDPAPVGDMEALVGADGIPR